MIKLWLWPVTLAILTATGLVSGLMSDGVGDFWAWIGLGTPLLIGAYYSFFHKRIKSID